MIICLDQHKIVKAKIKREFVRTSVKMILWAVLYVQYELTKQTILPTSYITLEITVMQSLDVFTHRISMLTKLAG